MGQLTRVTLLLSLVLGSTGFAADSRALEDAKVRFKRGTELYDEGNYRGALIEFDRAYQAIPNYRILYNIGQVELQLLEYARAQDAFSRYLKEGGSDVPAARREEVNRELERLKARVGRIAVTAADGAEVLVDDESVGFTPLPNSIAANTGRHKVTVLLSGKPPQNRMVEVAGLETVTVAIAKDAPVASGSTTPSSSGTTSLVDVGVSSSGPAAKPSKVPLVLGWVATGLVAGTAGLFAGLAFGASDDLKKQKAMLGVSQATLTAGAARVSSLSATADILGLVAVVGGGVSLYFTIASLTSESVSLTVGPAGIGAYGRF